MSIRNHCAMFARGKKIRLSLVLPFLARVRARFSFVEFIRLIEFRLRLHVRCSPYNMEPRIVLAEFLQVSFKSITE